MDQLPSQEKQGFWGRVKTVLIFGFVAWHLLFLGVQNFLSLAEKDVDKWKKDKAWWKAVEPAYDKLNRSTKNYGIRVGIDQYWLLFTSPVAKRVAFPGVRLTFADGSKHLIRSVNEPEDPSSYLHVGYARLRKFETFIVYNDLQYDYREPMWKQYIRWRVRHWRGENPKDKRRLTTVTLVKRTFRFPAPQEDPSQWKKPTEEDIVEYKTDWSWP